MTYVLVHGATFAGSCWDLHDVVLVGHSLAGITLPGVAARVPERLARLVFIGATVPEHGQTVLQALDVATQEVAADSMAGEHVAAPEDWARSAFCNDMDDQQTAWTLAHMGPEAPGVMTEPVDLQGLTGAVPRTWILTMHDAVVDVERQLLYAQRAGADVVELDAAHMAMISQPERLAKVLRSMAGVR